MGCQSDVVIGDNLVFSIATHDPDTGVLTDADSLPTYRIYEDETAVAILTGSMAKLDDANTTGFYTELIACTAANGFESGKTYTIYIQATVDSDTGGIAYNFAARNCVCSTGTGSSLDTYTVTSSVTGLPIQGVVVTVTTDIAGTNVVAYGTTDVAGEIDFWLNPGTYYMWSAKSGFTFTNPDTEVVV